MKLITVVVLMPLSFLAACSSSNYGANTYQTGLVQQQMRVKTGVVLEVREVEIIKKNSNIGSATGASAGSIAGSVVGSANGSTGQGIAGAIVGAVVGGVAGAVADRVGRTATGLEILFKLDGTEDVRALVQEIDENSYKPGDRVRLLEGSFAARLVPLRSN